MTSKKSRIKIISQGPTHPEFWSLIEHYMHAAPLSNLLEEKINPQNIINLYKQLHLQLSTELHVNDPGFEESLRIFLIKCIYRKISSLQKSSDSIPLTEADVHHLLTAPPLDQNQEMHIKNMFIDFFRLCEQEEKVFVTQTFEPLIRILDQVTDFEQNHRNSQTDSKAKGPFDKNILKALQFHDQLMNKALEEDYFSESDSLESLDGFLHQYSTHAKIKALQQANLKHNEIFEKIKKTHHAFDKFIEHYNQRLRQHKLVQLLEDKLAGTRQKEILPKPIAQKSPSTTAAMNDLMLNEDLLDPIYYPEHPANIGYSETLKLGLNKAELTVSMLFSTEKIKNDFLLAFPWAKDIKRVEELEDIDLLETDNLLGTKQSFPPDIQVLIMRYVLVTLDTLGKVAGSKGEYAIQNFPTIKDLVDDLQAVAQRILDPLVYKEASFINQIKQKIVERIYLNDRLLSMQYDNSMMNQFCGVNEFISHSLKHITYERQQSPLRPVPKI